MKISRWSTVISKWNQQIQQSFSNIKTEIYNRACLPVILSIFLVRLTATPPKTALIREPQLRHLILQPVIFRFFLPAIHSQNFLISFNQIKKKYQWYFYNESVCLHCTKNRIYVFPEEELRGFSPKSYIHVAVSDLYYIFLELVHIFGCSKIDWPILEIYIPFTDIWV